MKWTVPGDPERRLFDDKYPAFARAWELTPIGGHRAEPIQIQEENPRRTRRIIDGPVYMPPEPEFEFEVIDLKFAHRFEDEIDVFADDVLIATKPAPTGLVDVTAEMVAPYGVASWGDPASFKVSVKERLDEFLKAKGYNYDRLEVGHIDHLVGSTKGHRIIVQAIAILGDRS